MSTYYNIQGLKVRVSDHEPNTSLRGSNDLNLYIKSASNELLSIESQIERFCINRGYNVEDFREVLNDWKDGSYSVDAFVSKKEESDSSISITAINSIRELNSIPKDIETYIRNFSFSCSYGDTLRSEIKALSEATGVSQSKIKKLKNIR